jgi:hypothetical protein
MKNITNDYLPALTFEDGGASDQRLRELILYVADRSYDDEGFGATKLNKILYFSDFESYARYGASITGAEYISLPNGPVPRRLISIRNEMERDHEIAIRKVSYYDKEQHRVIPLRDCRLELFTVHNIAAADAVISRYWGKTAREMSELSHDRVWRIAGTTGVRVPKEAVFISNEGLTDYDIARTSELAAEHGWRDL